MPARHSTAGRVKRAVAKPAARRRGAVPAERDVSARDHVSQMQRARLIGAAVPAVDELGWSGVTVADIAARARVSRRTFYDLFSDREDCLLAMLDQAVGSIEQDLQAAGLEGCSWLVRVRRGLWTILCWLDRDPVLARVCVVQALRGGPRVLERRAEILGRLASVLDQGRGQNPRREQTSGLTAEGLVGAAVTILHARLLAGAPEPLESLTGELMGLIVLPYLGPAAARHEQHRTDLVSRRAVASGGPSGALGRAREDSLKEVPMRLTYRTALVLQTAAKAPGASNRVIGEGAGITDQGQISKLLARLEGLGLLANTGAGQAKGEPNAWSLTELGERVTEQLALTTTKEQK